MKALLHRFWNYLTQVSDDGAYERYLTHHRAHHADSPAMTRREFFRRWQDEKWSKISRRC